MDGEIVWALLYTKGRAEVWAEANLRRQGFDTLLPLTHDRGGRVALFPRYVFAGWRPGQAATSMRGTFGVQYVVNFGDRPALVPHDVIAEVRSRMDEHGVVRLESSRRPAHGELYAKSQRARVQALLRLAENGWRVIDAAAQSA